MLKSKVEIYYKDIFPSICACAKHINEFSFCVFLKPQRLMQHWTFFFANWPSFSFNCLLSGKSFFTTIRTQLECLHATCSETSRNYKKKSMSINLSMTLAKFFQWKWLAFMSKKKCDSWHGTLVRKWAKNELVKSTNTWM